MDPSQKQEFHLRDLPTRSVTLFPARAQVVRNIKNVTLKPGENEISIVGLTPTVDEQSIKVEGIGSAAIISNIATELLPNRDIYQEIYPESDSEDDDTDTEDEEDDEVKANAELKAVRKQLVELRDEETDYSEQISSANRRLKILDEFGTKMLAPEHEIDIEKGLESYRAERQKVYETHQEAVRKNRDLEIKIKEVVEQERKLEQAQHKEQRKVDKAKAKVEKAKAKEKKKAWRREQEKQKEKQRVKKERERFWPKSCYIVRITIDASIFTPSSSRRSSVASVTELAKASPEESGKSLEAAVQSVDLALTYITTSAFWSPSYDLQLDTIKNSGILHYDAQLTNMTSETWSGCKIILSTSEQVFSGLGDAIPVLQPWRVGLVGKGGNYNKHGSALESMEEVHYKKVHKAQALQQVAQKPRHELFGVNSDYQAHGQSIQPFGQMQLHMARQMHQAPQAPPPPQAPAPYAPGGLFGMANANNNASFGRGGSGAFGAANNVASSSAFGGNSMPVPALAASVGARSRKAKESAPRMRSAMARRAASEDDSEGGAEDEEAIVEQVEASFDVDGATMLEAQPELAFQESAMEESGLTTTYDLPGSKTLAPSSIVSKQHIARVTFANVIFSHTIVAKLKPAAYLKAKLRNASKLTLLKGSAGLTLDGSFMGRTSLPRCSAGDTFPLSLGIDPAIKVVYPKPEVKRSTSGFLSKEDSSVYTRTITITNTRASAGKPIQLLVLDQVPVSEEERLRVEILRPRGMNVGGNGVPAGQPHREGGGNASGLDWGRATANLKKGGEVSWDVSLNAGMAVKLALEYDVSLPAGDAVYQVNN